MTAFRRLAWTAAAATYLLIVFGAWVRITGSGMGCGDDWPLCNGHVLPPFDDLATVIEWGHRQLAALVSLLVFAVAGYAWWSRRNAGSAKPQAVAYAALGLLVVQVLLGAVTVKLELPHWTVVLHLATAMLLLAALLAAALGWRGERPAPAPLGAVALGLATVLLGGMTAKLGAASACLGFPLCNGQVIPEGNYLQAIHWTHRLVAYGLAGYTVVWAWRDRRAGPRVVLGLLALQVSVAAWMVVSGLPRGLQALHVAVGTAVWAALVVTALAGRGGRGAPRSDPSPLPHPASRSTDQG
ncbi:MAG TPA: COX15/CtaA family protein [Gemmatimonadales bacterium]|nr:COX15/CtaA family protein [Gemmatimonadales bacterium]